MSNKEEHNPHIYIDGVMIPKNIAKHSSEMYFALNIIRNEILSGKEFNLEKTEIMIEELLDKTK